MFSRRLAWPPRENRLAALLRAKRSSGARLLDLTASNPTRVGLAYPVQEIAAALAALLRAKRSSGARLLDLTESNPTRVGLPYPVQEIAAALADPGAAVYEPDPRGHRRAREAVAAWCGRRGLAASPDRTILTASTSEAYALLFKMLADPGDAILVPQPGYPLFDELAALESVRPVPYPIVLERDWRVDLDALAGLLAAATGAAGGGTAPRAVVVVNPNNPTGSALTAAERDRIDALAARAGASVIADEVFFDYLSGTEARVSLAGPRPGAASPAALTFTLGGLSKACGLPQMKLGWILVDGPAEARAEALGRLEFIADSYLSVGTPVQRAAERLLALGDGIAALIRERVDRNRHVLAAAFPGGSASRVLPSDGGWYAVLQVPAVRSEEEMVLDLLAGSDLLVHPGYFFDFAREAFLVLSLLPEPGVFDEAIRRLKSRVAG